MEEKTKLYLELAEELFNAFSLQTAIFTFYVNSTSSESESKKAVLDELDKTQQKLSKWKKRFTDLQKEESFTLPHTWQITFTPEKNIIDEI